MMINAILYYYRDVLGLKGYKAQIRRPQKEKALPKVMSKEDVIFYKNGYKTQYIDLQKKYDYQTDSLTIKMTPSATTEELGEGLWSTTLQILLILISIFNVATLVYIISTKTQYKALWIVAMVAFSMTIEYNYFNGDYEISLFNFLLQFSNKFGW